jgi:hypothetical protein
MVTCALAPSAATTLSSSPAARTPGSVTISERVMLIGSASVARIRIAPKPKWVVVS